MLEKWLSTKIQKNYYYHYSIEALDNLENFFQKLNVNTESLLRDFYYLRHDDEGIYYYKHKINNNYLCIKNGELIEGYLDDVYHLTEKGA